MSDKIVTLEKAINAIKTAAEEIPAEDFISYSTILDVHLLHAQEEFSPEDQYELLEALAEVLKAHEPLFRDIAWDLVSVLLPFLESTNEKTVEIAEQILADAAKSGNPREVFIKTLESLSSLSWTIPEDELEEDGKGYQSGEEEESEAPEAKEAKAREEMKKRDDTIASTWKKYSVLVAVLQTVHSRITTQFPSRFLSTELTTLLASFSTAVETVDRNGANKILDLLLNYVEFVSPPNLPQRPQEKEGERPPLPPRRSTSDLLKAPEIVDESPEVQLQARLLLSFLSHLLEVYLLRTKRQLSTSTAPQTLTGPEMPVLELGDTDGRSLDLGWAGKYDEEVVRKGRSKVPGGTTLIDEERAEREKQGDVKVLVERLAKLSTRFGLKTEELLGICEAIEDQSHPEAEDGHEHSGAPKSASDVPLSKAGSLFLLAARLSAAPSSAILRIFPEHDQISRSFMIYGQGQSQPPVLDALLFLGALALQTGKLGEIPYEVEPFLIYLQIFAVASAAASSPQARFLSHLHVRDCLRLHPNDAFRLAYVRDTLEHCPFESLKAAVVGILKDEIIVATQLEPASSENEGEDSVPPSPSAIFSTPLVLQELSDFLFPDLVETLSSETEKGKVWESFKELYPRLISTANLYYFLLLSPATRDRLAVTEKSSVDMVETRFLEPLRKCVERFKDTYGDGAGEVQILGDVIERISEVKTKINAGE